MPCGAAKLVQGWDFATPSGRANTWQAVAVTARAGRRNNIGSLPYVLESGGEGGSCPASPCPAQHKWSDIFFLSTGSVFVPQTVTN